MTPPSNNIALKIILAILFLALFAEIGYVFVTSNKKEAETTIITPTITAVKKESTQSDKELQGKVTKIEISGVNITKLILRLDESYLTTSKFDLSINAEGLKRIKVFNLAGQRTTPNKLKESQNIKFNPTSLEIKIVD